MDLEDVNLLRKTSAGIVQVPVVVQGVDRYKACLQVMACKMDADRSPFCRPQLAVAHRSAMDAHLGCKPRHALSSAAALESVSCVTPRDMSEPFPLPRHATPVRTLFKGSDQDQRAPNTHPFIPIQPPTPEVICGCIPCSSKLPQILN